MKPLTVKDPSGVEWRLTLTSEMVRTASLERAIEQSGMTDREKRKARKEMGVPMFSGGRGLFLRSFDWRVGWSRDHSYAWVMHAISKGEHKAWLSPARRRSGALADLDQLAAQISLGEEPRPSHP